MSAVAAHHRCEEGGGTSDELLMVQLDTCRMIDLFKAITFSSKSLALAAVGV